MTPEEALRNILRLVNGSDEMEDVHALHILLQSIKTLAEKGFGAVELALGPKCSWNRDLPARLAAIRL